MTRQSYPVKRISMTCILLPCSVRSPRLKGSRWWVGCSESLGAADLSKEHKLAYASHYFYNINRLGWIFIPITNN